MLRVSVILLSLALLVLLLLLPLTQAFVVPASSLPSTTTITTRPSKASLVGPLESLSLDSFFGKGSASNKASPGASTATVGNPVVTITELRSRQDLRVASSVCIESFFGGPDRLNPIKSMQLATLLDEQLMDLKSRFGGRAVGGSVYLQAVDKDGVMQGFCEVGITQSLKYGMGAGIPVRDERPYLANLSVRPGARRQGIGRALVQACEEMVQKWGYDELILQVEDANEDARRLYRQLGFEDLYTDATGRKYELSGMSIRSVRINKVSMRKQLAASALAAKNPFASFFSQLSFPQQA